MNFVGFIFNIVLHKSTMGEALNPVHKFAKTCLYGSCNWSKAWSRVTVLQCNSVTVLLVKSMV